MALSDQWQAYQKIATHSAHTVNRNDWRVGNIAIYLADTTEKAYEDVANGALEEINQYTFNAGGKPTYEAYPGQPASEITFEQIVEQRGWIIGDPDHCVRRIKELEKETGGFGGLLMLTTEWTSTQNWYRSLELFARYVMPHFKGHTSDLKREWKRTQDLSSGGELPFLLGSDLSSDYPMGGSKSNLSPEK